MADVAAPELAPAPAPAPALAPTRRAGRPRKYVEPAEGEEVTQEVRQALRMRVTARARYEANREAVSARINELQKARIVRLRQVEAAYNAMMAAGRAVQV